MLRHNFEFSKKKPKERYFSHSATILIKNVYFDIIEKDTPITFKQHNIVYLRPILIYK